MEIGVIISAIVAVVGFGTAVGTYWATRRRSSGHIDTTEAGTLWQQTQVMLTVITSERDKAIEQRDRLMKAQSEQIIPITSSLLSAVQQLKDVLEQRDSKIDRIARQVDALTRRYMSENR